MIKSIKKFGIFAVAVVAVYEGWKYVKGKVKKPVTSGPTTGGGPAADLSAQ